MMCVACRALGTRSYYALSSFDAAGGCGGVIEARVNAVTGEVIPVEPWVNDIHPEDWDWYQRHWDEEDLWNYRFEIEMAKARETR